MMIYNQVLEQFGDWTLFWNSFRNLFIDYQLNLEFFLDKFDRGRYPELYQFRKEEIKSLLEEIGYENVSFSNLEREMVVEELMKREVHRLTAASYNMTYPHLVQAVDVYKKGQTLVRFMAGEDLALLTPPLRWLLGVLDENYYHHNYKARQFSIMFMNLNKHPLSGMEELLHLHRIRNKSAEYFNLWQNLPLPKDKEDLMKKLNLFFETELTNQKMDELGVIRSAHERLSFQVEEELRRLAPYRRRVTSFNMGDTNVDLQIRQLGSLYVMQGDAMKLYPTDEILSEDPSLALDIQAKALIDCELLKRDFFRQSINSFFMEDRRDFWMLHLSSFLSKTLREDLVSFLEKGLHEYYIALQYHHIGLWLRTMVAHNLHHQIESVLVWRFTQFTYFLLLFLFLSFFFFFTRKIFYSGWWRGNVTIVSFLFNLVKEQANIRAILHLPLLLTVFLWILSNNLVGLLPFGYAITSHILFTFFLGFSLLIGITILIWQEKKREMIQLFLPKGVPSFLVPFLFVIELISYLFRTVSLSVRLFANMMAGHALLHILTNFGVVISSLSSPLRFFFIFPLMIVALITFLELGIALLQAYVFTVLLAIYLNDVYSLESH